jgi:soluble lytic murein transglycosylase-like protein
VKPWTLGPLYLTVLLLLGACWVPVEDLPSPIPLPEPEYQLPQSPEIPELEQPLPEGAERVPVPRLARQYQRELTILAQREFGLGAPVALLAGQVHQESAWRDDVATGLVRSSAGAQGLTQFMPGTAKWIVERYPDLGTAEPFNPLWALRAMVRYDRHLYDRAKGNTECDKWWWTLRSYNGGEGHMRLESANAADPLDRASVDAECGTARRAKLHCKENLGYPQKITERWEPLYLSAGWRGSKTCTG